MLLAVPQEGTVPALGRLAAERSFSDARKYRPR
jgi:hypothetical protein